MAKISKPLIYVATLLVVGGVGYVLTEPEATVKKAETHAGQRSIVIGKATDNLITDADRHVRFPLYAATGRDAFLPRVVASRALTTASTAGKPGTFRQGGRGVWVLTGINSINGQVNALLENSASNDTQFVKVGDDWNGQHVVKVTEDMVVLVNGMGQRTELTFPSLDDAAKKPDAGPTAPEKPLGVAPPAPGTPPPPFPQAPPQGVNFTPTDFSGPPFGNPFFDPSNPEEFIIL